MKLSKDHEQLLADMAGRLPNGNPKLRIVTPEEAVRPHGQLAGVPKYLDPVSGQQMPFLVLEQWYPPTMLGSEETWNEEVMGIFPGKCGQDCCNNGYWGFRMPLTDMSGQYMPYTDYLMESIKRRQFVDIDWSKRSPEERLAFLDAERAFAEQKAAEIAQTDHAERYEHYLQHKTQEDNADNRIIIGLGKNTLPDTKGGKLPIGSPLEKYL